MPATSGNTSSISMGSWVSSSKNLLACTSVICHIRDVERQNRWDHSWVVLQPIQHGIVASVAASSSNPDCKLIVHLYSNLSLSPRTLAELRYRAEPRATVCRSLTSETSPTPTQPVALTTYWPPRGKAQRRLAAQFQIQRTTVTALLRRHGVKRRRS